MYNREIYLDQLIRFRDQPIIKVLVGPRRSGKSSILQLYANELIKTQVSPGKIFHLNFESFEWSDIANAEKLYAWFKTRISKEERVYILLDEIQEVANWERAINSLMTDFNADLVITGSNSKLLSSELATFLTGRYVEIPVYTLSFKESRTFSNALNTNPEADKEQAFDRYLISGGFPVLYTFPFDQDTGYKIIFDIYSSAILRDTVQRFGIRDVELLERLVKFIMDNVGQKFSAKSIADYFKSQQRKLDINTIYNYLNALESAFIIYRVPRYDIRGKELLKTFEKYFLSDHGLTQAVLGKRPHLISGILENIVCVEMMRRGYQVFVGKLDDIEIDFIAEKANEKIYIQVAYRLDDPSTLERERKPFLQIDDNYPKYILTMDKRLSGNVDGILTRFLPDFLLSHEI